MSTAKFPLVLAGLGDALVHSAVSDEQYLAAVSASIRMAATTRPATSWDAGGARAYKVARGRRHVTGRLRSPTQQRSAILSFVADTRAAVTSRVPFEGPPRQKGSFHVSVGSCWLPAARR
jgi:hypothetical protein